MNNAKMYILVVILGPGKEVIDSFSFFMQNIDVPVYKQLFC